MQEGTVKKNMVWGKNVWECYKGKGHMKDENFSLHILSGMCNIIFSFYLVTIVILKLVNQDFSLKDNEKGCFATIILMHLPCIAHDDWLWLLVLVPLLLSVLLENLLCWREGLFSWLSAHIK